ncbi:MAG: lipoyl synthase [Deltaproteobacteria bacterium]|nr:lipoyl synthase [Deltaproteobacteria bacterium]
MKGSRLEGLEVLDWSLLEYGEALLRQKALVEERIAGSSSDRVVLVEHPPVVTIGRSGTFEDLRIPAEALRQRGVALHYVDRGGMVTFHGPGQMVAYPIVKLNNRDLHLYLQTLQDTVAAVLRTYGLSPAFREGKPGVWLGSAKVASIGIAMRKWVTYHGVALNVNTDLKCFNWIVPCGDSDAKTTSMEHELGFSPDLAEVKKHFIEAFGTGFGYTKGPSVQQEPSKHPVWLIRNAPCTATINRMEERLSQWRLATVCQIAHCPNLGECFARGTATFMILGTRCTRWCRFCAVDKGVPQQVDPEEPERVAQVAQTLGLRYVVVTSVTRDDLSDGGADQFIRTIHHLRRLCPDSRVEVLVPDFKGSLAALQRVCEARLDIFNHNIETVARLYPRVRPQAHYRRSLGVLEYAARQGLRVKSGLMLGLGETEREVMETFADLKRTGCHYLTIGQYLSASKDHVPVARFVSPEEFERWAETARSMGFKGVAAGPLVRSSYRADEMFETFNA